MLLSSLIEELCSKEEINEAGCTLTFGGQCTLRLFFCNFSYTFLFLTKQTLKQKHLEDLTSDKKGNENNDEGIFWKSESVTVLQEKNS